MQRKENAMMRSAYMMHAAMGPTTLRTEGAIVAPKTHAVARIANALGLPVARVTTKENAK